MPQYRRIAGPLALALVAAACASVADGPDVRALPVLEREEPVPSAPRITDWFWPFGHDEVEADSRSDGFRPLYRGVTTPTGEAQEILYPLWRSSVEKGIVATRLFPLYWHDAVPQAGGFDVDWAVLPFFFWGSEPGQGSWFLFFPVGGHAHQKFLCDEITMVLFPAFARTRNGAWRGTHLVWPLVHWGSDGKGRRAFRFWPFYGMSVKEGRFDRRTVLWPIVHWGTENLHTKHPVSGWLVWPLLGHTSADDGFSTWTVLWPFFEWADGATVYERSIPYPFYRVRKEFEVAKDGTRKETSDLFWLWPFHGRYDRHGEESSRFWLWPIVSTSEAADGHLWERASGVLPFWRRVERTPREGGPGNSWWKLWPLAQGDARADGGSQWSSLSPIPWFRWAEFDANWGVFFELARVREDPDGSRATDLLFSLVRDRRGPRGTSHRVPLLWKAENGEEGASWDLLEGLLGGSTDAAGRSSLRLLWFLRIPAGGDGPR